jgi:hypothetical protein
MKRAAILAIAAACVAHAEDFRSRAPIALQGTDPFQRIQLPVEAYREGRADLGDLRVLNGRGEAVPIAFVGEAVPEREKAVTVRLPQFAVTSPAGSAPQGRVDVQVRTLADGTLMSVQQRAAGKAVPAQPSAYFLDASQLKFPIGALIFDWEVKPGSEIVKVNVEASDDLRDWRPAAPRATLVRLEQAGQALSQTQVPLFASRAKYYRVTGAAHPFVLRSVDAESAPATVRQEQPSKMTTAAATRTPEGDFVFDLEARLPVEAIRVVFRETNSVAPFEISTRDGPNAAWRHVTTATFYRISRDGTEITSPFIEVRAQPAREWRLHPQVKSASEGQAPSLEVKWRPAEMVFVAKGDPPFTLAFGDREARATSIPVSSLMPGYERGNERKLAFATVGAVSTAPPPPPPMQIFGMTPRKAGLWAVLLVGVLVLGFMAWRLMGQMKAK